MDTRHATALASLLGDDTRVFTDPRVVEPLSRDFYWYSPVLRKQLDGKVGEMAVQPVNAAEVQMVLRYCHANNLAVTVRGAGTGNYGQAVPLRGGVVLDPFPLPKQKTEPRERLLTAGATGDHAQFLTTRIGV